MSRRIALVSAYFLPHLGGVEQFTASLSRELASMGYGIDIITSNLGSQREHEVIEDGLQVFRLPCVSLLGDRYPVIRRGKALRGITDELGSRAYFGMLINTRFYQTTTYGLALGKRVGVRPVVLDHGSSYIGFGVPAIDWAVRLYERHMTKRAVACSPDFYGVSQMSADWLGTLGIEAKGTIHNALDVAEFDQLASERDFRAELGVTGDGLLVAFTGRLLAAKGIWEVLDTARRVLDRGVEATFVLAGDGPDKDKAQQDAPANVRFVGRLDRADVSALLHASDLFLFPSTYPEGMPTSILEASASGITTIGTNVGGVRELLPDESYGIVQEKPDAQAMTEMIVWYDAHRDVLAERGARCRRLVEEEFSWRKTAEAVVAACERARR